MESTSFTVDVETMRKNFARISENTAVSFLEIQLESLSKDQIVLTMPISDKTRQPLGLLHGGITMALVETACSYHASWGVDLSKMMPVGIEINGSHVRSAREGTIRAVANVVRRSRSMIVHQVEVTLVETGDLLSTARMTNYYKPVNREA